VPVTASIASEFGSDVGVLAGMIAIGGFLAHARPVLDADDEEQIRQATVRGGLVGLCAGVLVVVLSAIESMLFT